MALDYLADPNNAEDVENAFPVDAAGLEPEVGVAQEGANGGYG
jgi:ActR/RegA family two-component response regulator